MKFIEILKAQNKPYDTLAVYSQDTVKLKIVLTNVITSSCLRTSSVSSLSFGIDEI